MNLLAIDPGVNCLGYAVFENSRLACAGVSTRVKGRTQWIQDHALEVECAIRLKDPASGIIGSIGFQFVVCEYMTHYAEQGRLGRSRKASDAIGQDLIDCAIAGAYVAGRCAPYADLVLVRPQEWKRQLPKGVVAKRILGDSDEGARASRLLDATETLAATRDLHPISKSLRHNAIDAIGIGLWFLGRRVV